MDIRDIVAELDSEITLLTQVRALLSGTKQTARKPRTMSADARKRIADAQRKRWAKAKKAAK